MTWQVLPNLHGAKMSAPPDRDKARSVAPAVTRAAAILDVLAEDGAAPLGVSELARRLGIAKSSVANLCNALADAGLLQRVEGGYRLGRKLAALGVAYLSGVDIVREFHDVVGLRSVTFEETLQLAVLNADLDVVYLARRDGSAPVRLVSDVGRHLPASCTATGKALLADLSESELTERLAGRSELPALTPRSITDPEQLRAELENVRRRGYAIDDEETTEGVLCVAMTLSNEEAGSNYALSFTLLKARAGIARIEHLVEQLRLLTAELGRRTRI